MTDDTCYLFGGTLDGKGGATTVDKSFESATPPHWVHIDYSSDQARGWLAERGLEPFVIDTLIRNESRPNMVAVDDGLLIVLRGINRNAGADPEDMVSLRIWIERDRMISVRQRKVIAAREVFEELEHSNGPKDLAGLLTRLIERLADGIAVFVDDIEERMEQHEADVETGEPAEYSGLMYPLSDASLRLSVASSHRNAMPSMPYLGKENHFSMRTNSTWCASSPIV